MDVNLHTRLHQTCWKNTPEEVRDILEEGADPNGYCDNDYGWFPLHVSAYHDNKEITEALVQHGARRDVVTHRGNLPLHFAARHGSTDVLALLLSVTRDKNKQNEDGNTALHWAVEDGKTEAVRLLAPVTDLTIRNKRGETPLDIAARRYD